MEDVVKSVSKYPSLGGRGNCSEAYVSAATVEGLPGTSTWYVVEMACLPP